VTTLDVLQQAQVLLVTHGWTQLAYARDAFGRKCDELDPGAKRFCLLGALRAAAGNAVDVPISFENAVKACYQIFDIQLAQQLWGSLIAWHDAPERTRDEVLNFLESVIAREVAA
jgi:hypothetical protein